jgi:hypothetical protein
MLLPDCGYCGWPIMRQNEIQPSFQNVRLNDNQMECIIAAILAAGSLGAAGGASLDKTIERYCFLLARLRKVGYLNPPAHEYVPGQRT